MRVLLQPVFILHYRPYRETSALLDVFSQEYGRISLVARGVRSSRSAIRSLLQPFIALWMSWTGKSELMTLTTVERRESGKALSGKALLSAFYLNELMVRLLPKHDPYPHLYHAYEQSLLNLGHASCQAIVLRIFEKKLLEALGYGLHFQHDCMTGEPILPEHYYLFYPDQGFRLCEDKQAQPSSHVFLGKSLLAFAEEVFEYEPILQDAKRLMRLVLSPLLGSQPLQSRKLFIKNE